MVGDSWVDVKTARNAGVAAAGVNWGMQPESLREEPPDVLVDEMAELTQFVLARKSSV
jgi:phosphoglycolate phosphatase-like HAD superfamily hydrolase